ncbi:TPA: hypothetical protein I7160_09710 [Vibrio vulnificus]|uniref:tetratricopeptide repeat protein n=1 Tax=Vibrio vulnificus TaxID=672 RepID=UPI001A231A35|nr:tetratricopeptide repeat protein [Vibrio vulnificus]MCA0759791.1 sel1 repeat family protein [Vibrio vulnificus]HAS6042247.1 hypothetical protein [Vibrio vulnificus]HAS6183679.1 hypothetical protein [Vibrio vulnificus]
MKNITIASMLFMSFCSFSMDTEQSKYQKASLLNEEANYYSSLEDGSYDFEKSIELYEQAIKENYYPSYYNYYITCKNEKKNNCDMTTAIGYLEIAAENGIAEAQNELGSIYWNGVYRNKNIDNALKWYELSAKNGSYYGSYNVGRILYIYKNKPEEARAYLEVAVKENLIPAKDLLARYLLEYGNKSNDDFLAVSYLKEASDEGYAKSMYRLALCYIYGVGVDKNIQIARELLKSSESGGVEESKEFLDKLESGEFD